MILKTAPPLKIVLSTAFHECNGYCAQYPDTCPLIRRVEVPPNLATFSSFAGPPLLPLDVQSAIDPVLVPSDSLSWDNGAEGVPAPLQGASRTEVPQSSRHRNSPTKIQRRVQNASTSEITRILADPNAPIVERAFAQVEMTERLRDAEQWDPQQARDNEAKRSDRIARHNERRAARQARRAARGGAEADTESTASSTDLTTVLALRARLRGAELPQRSFLSEFTETELPREGNERLSASSRISPPERVADTQLVQTASALQSRATTSVQPSRLTDGGDRTVSVANFSQTAAFAVAQIASNVPQIDHAAPPILVRSRAQLYTVLLPPAPDQVAYLTTQLPTASVGTGPQLFPTTVVGTGPQSLQQAAPGRSPNTQMPNFAAPSSQSAAPQQYAPLRPRVPRRHPPPAQNAIYHAQLPFSAAPAPPPPLQTLALPLPPANTLVAPAGTTHFAPRPPILRAPVPIAPSAPDPRRSCAAAAAPRCATSSARARPSDSARAPAGRGGCERAARNRNASGRASAPTSSPAAAAVAATGSRAD